MANYIPAINPTRYFPGASVDKHIEAARARRDKTSFDKFVLVGEAVLQQVISTGVSSLGLEQRQVLGMLALGETGLVDIIQGKLDLGQFVIGVADGTVFVQVIEDRNG